MQNKLTSFFIMIFLSLISTVSMAAEKVVNVYSARHYDTDREIYNLFTKATGIKVNLVEGKADALISRIEKEGQHSPADVLITVDAGRLWKAEKAGILQLSSSKTLNEKVPAHLRHPDGLWHALSKRVRVLVYAKDRVKKSDLTSYEDLAKSKWKGKVLVRTSNNIYNQSLVGSLIEANGKNKTTDWARKLVDNMARSPKGNDTAQIKAVAAGIGDVAIVNHYYVARLMSSSDPEKRKIVKDLGVFFPNQSDRGAHINISGAAVLKHAPHKQDAIRFIEFLLSDEAQSLYAKGNNEYPVVKSVKKADILDNFGSFKEDNVNVSTYGINQSDAIKLMDKAGWK